MQDSCDGNAKIKCAYSVDDAEWGFADFEVSRPRFLGMVKCATRPTNTLKEKCRSAPSAARSQNPPPTASGWEGRVHPRATPSYQRRKKLTLFWPFCVSRQKRFAFRLRRGLRLYPEALSRHSRDRYGGRSRGPYTSEHKSHSYSPLVSHQRKDLMILIRLRSACLVY